MEGFLIIPVGMAFMAFAMFVMVMVVKSFYVTVDQGQVLIISSMQQGVRVAGQSGIVYPTINNAEVMDVTIKVLQLSFAGRSGVVCADNIRGDLSAKFMVRVNPIESDILKVAQAIGCERAGNLETMTELFSAKFNEAVKIVGKQRDFAEHFANLDQFREQIIQTIGRDLNGYSLEEVVIANFEQTPIEDRDPNNILDAEGIRKITEIATANALKVNELHREKEATLCRFAIENPEIVRELTRYLKQ